MRQTFIAALLSAVVLGDGVLINSDDDCPQEYVGAPLVTEKPEKATDDSTRIA